MTGPVRLEHAKLVAVLQQQAAHRLHQLVLVPRLIVLPALPWILPGVRTTLAFVAFVALPLPFGWQWFLEPILLHRCCRFRKCDPKELSDLFVHITMSIIMTMLMMVMMVMVMMVVVGSKEAMDDLLHGLSLLGPRIEQMSAQLEKVSQEVAEHRNLLTLKAEQADIGQMRSQLGSLGHGLAQKVDQLDLKPGVHEKLSYSSEDRETSEFMTTAMQKITRIGEQLENKAASGRLDQLEERLSKVLQGIERKAEDMALRRLEEQVIVLGEGVEGKAERNELQKAQEKLQEAHSFLLVALAWSLSLSLTMTTEISRTFRCKAVITDVDGTLMPFGKNKKISERNQQALQKAFDEGLAVCVATGRIPGPWYDELRAQVPLGPGVFANGALVLEPCPGPSPKILAVSSLPASAVETVLEQTSGGRFGGLRILVLAATMWEGCLRYVELAPEGPTWATDLIRSAGEPETVLLPTLRPLKDVHKFVLFTLPEEGWAAMADVVDSGSLAGHRVQNKATRRESTGVAILDCGPRQCEILPPGVNKGSGVKKLLEGLGLSLDSALACGDAENDVEMLEMVGLGIAVGDGKAKAMAAADIVVSPSTEDGVAEAIDIALGRLARDEAPDSLWSV
eukprot:s3900_g4.t3